MTISIIDHTKPGDGMSEERARELLTTEWTAFDWNGEAYLVTRYRPDADRVELLSEPNGYGWDTPDALVRCWRDGDITFRRAVLHLHPFEEGER